MVIGTRGKVRGGRTQVVPSQTPRPAGEKGPRGTSRVPERSILWLPGMEMGVGGYPV